MDVETAVKESITVAEALRKVGRAAVGSNYVWLKREAARRGLSTTHFKGKAHGKSSTAHAPEVVLVERSSAQTGNVKRLILKRGLLPYVCAECDIGPVWKGKLLVLRLDHKNGVRNDHRIENLRFLCPNCDSQTDTFCDGTTSALVFSRKLSGRAVGSKPTGRGFDPHRESLTISG